jgi:hypothetical protein
VKLQFVIALAGVAILSSSSCTVAPPEAELVARFLTEYAESVPETIRIDPAPDSLHLEGRGWNWEWSYRFTGAVARDGSGLRIGETRRLPNPW